LPYDTAFDRWRYVAESNRNDRLIRRCLDSAVQASQGTSFARLSELQAFRKQVEWVDQRLDSSLHRFNQADVMLAITDYYRQTEGMILPLIEWHCPQQLGDWHRRDLLFWQHRNAYMARQIVEYAKRYQAQRIVVLTGLLHKPFLKEVLDNQSNKKYITWVEYPESK
jgi:hypothetical protein